MAGKIQYTIIRKEDTITNFLCLPDEIILDILNYLPVQERLKCVARVCKRLYILAMDKRMVTDLHIDLKILNHPALIDFLADAVWLKTLDLTAKDFNKRFRALYQFLIHTAKTSTDMEDLDIEIDSLYAIFKSIFLKILVTVTRFCINLEELTLDYVKFFPINEIMRSLENLPSIDEEVFIAVSKFPKLRYLDIKTCISSSLFDFMIHPTFMDQLHVLRLRFMDKTPADLRHECRKIFQFGNNLKVLELHYDTKITPLIIFESCLDRLIELAITCNNHLDDNCMVAISQKCVVLQKLDISNCKKVTERGISSLKGCKSLRRIIATGIDLSIEFKHQFKTETKIKITTYYF